MEPTWYNMLVILPFAMVLLIVSFGGGIALFIALPAIIVYKGLQKIWEELG
jgi:hypothetical protein